MNVIIAFCSHYFGSFFPAVISGGNYCLFWGQEFRFKKTVDCLTARRNLFSSICSILLVPPDCCTCCHFLKCLKCFLALKKIIFSFPVCISYDCFCVAKHFSFSFSRQVSL